MQCHKELSATLYVLCYIANIPRPRRTTESGFESCGQLLLQIWLLSFDLLELTKVEQKIFELAKR